MEKYIIMQLKKRKDASMIKKFPWVVKLIFLLGELFIFVAAGQVAGNIVVAYGGNQVELVLYNIMLPISLIVIGVLFNIYGLFSLANKKYYEILASLAVAMINMLIIMLLVSFINREFNDYRHILLLATTLQIIFLALWLYLFWRVENGQNQRQYALLIGSQAECAHVMHHIQSQPQLNYQVKHICDEFNAGRWKMVAAELDFFIICSGVELQVKEEIIHYCHLHNKQVVIIPGFYELFCSGALLDKIDDIPVFRPRYIKPTVEQRSIKRLLDLVIAFGTLFFFWPLFFIIAVAIKVDSPGSVFYSQIRSGRDGTDFRIYKFRTMELDTEELTGPVMAEENDQRITQVGRILRDTRLDELPQVFNVILGSMSIVGPRPERPFFVEKFSAEIPEYVYRHNVKPGITGMAQVFGKYTTSPRDKLTYDLIYMQQCNVFTDLVIILQTLKVLMFKSNARGAARDVFKIDLSRYRI